MSGKKCLLNNVRIRNCRKDGVYQSVIIDLALVGVIDRELAEEMLGYSIPSYLTAPAKGVLKEDADTSTDE